MLLIALSIAKAPEPAKTETILILFFVNPEMSHCIDRGLGIQMDGYGRILSPESQISIRFRASCDVDAFHHVPSIGKQHICLSVDPGTIREYESSGSDQKSSNLKNDAECSKNYFNSSYDEPV